MFTYWILFKENKFLASKNNGLIALPDADLSILNVKTIRRHYLGQLHERSFYTAELDPDTLIPEGMNFYELRKLLDQIPEDLFFLIGKAYQIIHWDRTHHYCGRCGTQTAVKSDEMAKLCSSCGFVSYPRISPAIIVAVTRGQELLLARGNRFQPGFYSVLAGFVDPGETFEECVRREVEEEVGVKVKNIQYFGSQPWPFPDSLMVGFTAEYESGEIKIDNKEIMDAGWFSTDQLPTIPGTGSIARRLIDWFIRQRG